LTKKGTRKRGQAAFFLIIFMKIQKMDSFLYLFLFITKEICLMITVEITNENNKRIFEFVNEWI
jgi:hypothetical protein